MNLGLRTQLLYPPGAFQHFPPALEADANQALFSLPIIRMTSPWHQESPGACGTPKSCQDRREGMGGNSFFFIRYPKIEVHRRSM
jgi:hypothetical protein